MSSTVPTIEAFAALEARVSALEAQDRPEVPEPQPPEPEAPPGNPLAPSPPPKPDAMPGTSGRVLTVGPGQQYGTVNDAMGAARDGDTIQLSSDAPRQSFQVSKCVLIDGGGVRWDWSGVPANQLFQSKGAIVPWAAAWHIRNFTILGCGIAERSHTLVAGIRCSGAGWGIVERCALAGNQNGFAADGGLPWMLELIDCQLEDNGLGDGLTHNLYVNDGNTLKLTRVTSRNPRSGGHAIKSRAFHTIAEGGFFSANATPLELPNGGLFRVTGTSFAKPQGSPNRRLLSYAVENQNGGLFDNNVVEQATLDLQVNDPFIQTQGGTITFADDCRWHIPAGKVQIQGPGKVIGLP